MGQPLSRLWSAAPLCKGSQCAGKSLPYEGEAFVGNPPRKVSPFRLVETRVAHFDKKRAWNANCVQTQFGGDDRDRTDDLLNAIQTRSQLRYAPISNFTYLL